MGEAAVEGVIVCWQSADTCEGSFMWLRVRLENGAALPCHSVNISFVLGAQCCGALMRILESLKQVPFFGKAVWVGCNFDV